MDSSYYYPKENISISGLNAFDNCPFSFWMKYVQGHKPPEKSKLIFGRQFQEVLNAKYLGQDTKPLIGLMNPKSRGLASLLLTKAQDFDDIISVDKSFVVDMGFGHPIIFVPDLITKTGIVENKTTTGYYNADMVGKERQATLYYLGVRKKYGFIPDIIYQIFNTRDKTQELVPTERSDKDIDELMDWIEGQLKKIDIMNRIGRFDFGRHKFCDFKNVCPLHEKFGFQR